MGSSERTRTPLDADGSRHRMATVVDGHDGAHMTYRLVPQVDVSSHSTKTVLEPSSGAVLLSTHWLSASTDILVPQMHLRIARETTTCPPAPTPGNAPTVVHAVGHALVVALGDADECDDELTKQRAGMA